MGHFLILETIIRKSTMNIKKFGKGALFTVVFVLTSLLTPAMPAMAADGDPITINADYTLMSNMTFTGTGFIIGADNIILDLNGHTITGNYAPFTGDYTPGIVIIDRSGVTVKNGTIRGFTSAISLWGTSSGNVIQNLKVSNSYNGIDNHGDNNRILDNTITGSADCGIASRYTSSVNVFQNNKISASNIGIEIAGTDNQILGNTVTDSNKEGIVLRPPSNGNTVQDNKISISGATGIGIDGTNNQILGNRISDSAGPGIGINNNNNQVRNNQISNSGGEGIRLFLAVTGNTVQDNKISISGATGIGIDGTNNQVLGNKISDSAKEGIRLFPMAKYNLVQENKVSYSGFDGIAAVHPPLAPSGATDNTIKENKVKNSGCMVGSYYDLFDWSDPPANTWENNTYTTRNW